MKTDGQLKVEQPSAPRLHRVHQPPKTLNILNKIVVRSPQMEKIATRMASVESIGTCSLDVDVSAASEISDPADGVTVSQRTLRSTSGGSGSPFRSGSAECKSSPGERTEEKYVSELFVPVINGDNGMESEEKIPEQQRQLSYVNISCSVSGYTSYSCYNSKLREGLRSRDSSPARAAFSNLGEFSKRDVNNDPNRLGVNGISRTSPYGKAYSNGVTPESSPQRLKREEETKGLSNGVDEVDNVQTKSLVQQRIERLYGPAALAQGFLIRAKARNVYDGVTTVRRNSSGICDMRSSIGRSVDGKPVGKIVAAVMATPSLMTRTGPSAAGHEESSVRATGSSMGNAKTKGTTQRQLNGHAEVDIKLDSSAKENHGKEKEVEICSSPSKDKRKETAEEKDGSHFLNLMAIERRHIESLIHEAEQKLGDGSISDDIMAGRFRVTVGKANLLLAQKFKQFHGLCEKNLTQHPDEPFPTTVSDLAGFWDMVLIEVNKIYSMFRDIDLLRDEEWSKLQVSEVDGALMPRQLSNGVKGKRSTPAKKSTASVMRTPKAEEAAKAREEARKRLAEVKRKARSQLSSQQKGAEQDVEIFTPETKD